MGAHDSDIHAAEQPAADALLTAFRTIKAAERDEHARVLDYWRSIRGDKEFPPLHDFDPLQISDAGSRSILLELIGGGQDAEIRHFGEALSDGTPVQRIIDAPNPSILSCIAKKLPIVAISREFLAFEERFNQADGWTCCWVTLLPLSSCGSWVDYVYAFVSIDTNRGKAARAPEPKEVTNESPVDAATELAAVEEMVVDIPAVEPQSAAEAAGSDSELVDEASAAVEPVESVEVRDIPEPDAPAEAPAAKVGPGFARLIDGFANLTGFYGQSVSVELPAEDPEASEHVPAVEPEAVEPEAAEPEAAEMSGAEPEAIEPPAEPAQPAVEPEAPEPAAIDHPVEEAPEEAQSSPAQPAIAPEVAAHDSPAPASEDALLNLLSEVRAKADEARMAQLRATAALHEGLSAAYDFALDAETSPEEYLRLVEGQGMKIQLRSPMAPVVKLAFNGLADAATIAELETVLAWALKQELPRGTLAQRIEQAGGIDAMLNGAKAA